MMRIVFDKNAEKRKDVKSEVLKFFNQIEALENVLDLPVIIFQDGKNKSYYIKCSIPTSNIYAVLDLDAKLEAGQDSFRANRELLLNHNTFLKMADDAKDGREFNDIIVEYNLAYNKQKPLKVWGGQHRSLAIKESHPECDRHHGFKVYFCLTKKQRTEVALISNTNIDVSNDTFDRIQEETYYGDGLRKWCQQVGLLNKDENFPSQRSKSEKITVKLARSFIVNYYLGLEKGKLLKGNELDKNTYEPYIPETGINLDSQYRKILERSKDIWKNKSLIIAGKKFCKLHHVQNKSVIKSEKVRNRKAFRNKALIESVISSWAYVAGLLQSHKERLKCHYIVPKTNNRIPDPLNAETMSHFHHDQDPPTYRGLGARSSLKDRQRMAQVFLAKTFNNNNLLDKKLLTKAVSQVVGLSAMSKGYSS